MPGAQILIVDDDERNAFAACQALESLGCDLVIARSGEEALRLLLTEEFAVILLDLHMPGMDGYETAALIRQRRRTRDTPIVFLTAVFRDEAHLFQAYSAGAVDVVFKPVDPFILRSKVSVLVDLHLKTLEVRRQAEESRRLLEENVRVGNEKAAAEQALRQARARQEAILQSLPIVFHSRAVAPNYPALFVSDSVKTITGFEPTRFIEEPEFGLARVHPDDRPAVEAALAGAVETGAYVCEYRWRCADGSYRTLLDQGVLAPEAGGGQREIFGTLVDSTERRSLEEQLAQARKMEAVGQLTGGVAHDFNNLLTVILGNADLLLRRAGDDERLHRQLSAVRHAAERGRSLTRQLLAFSRRQHLCPLIVELNDLIREFMPLMQQAVGDAVTLSAESSAVPVRVHVDPAHLETALLNLAVNARDAMPSGGELTIRLHPETAAGAPRPDGKGASLVRIEVRDTGSGMSREVMERVFEPFFTTKEVGKGSGLGLSQVYGFVRQSGGHVTAASEEGQGSTFNLFLPLTEQKVEAREPAAAQAAMVGGRERLLVVEDDPAVLALTVDLLTGLGYRCTTAGDAAAALDKLKSGIRIDLLFSDVVMPGGVNGIELARQARALRPEIGIVLTSGYMGENAAISGSEFPLIDKPYEGAALAAMLRETLDALAGGETRMARAEAAQ